MGNNCCRDDEKEPSYMQGFHDTSASTLSVPSINKSKSAPCNQMLPRFQNVNKKASVDKPSKGSEKFLRKHNIHGLLFSTKGGLYESYLCTTKTNSNEIGQEKVSRKKLIQCISVKSRDLTCVQKRINQL